MYSSSGGAGAGLLFLVFFVAGIAIAAGIGYWIAGQKNRDGVEGAALGCFLGPIGWIIEAVLPTRDEPPASAPSYRSQRTTYRPRGMSGGKQPTSWRRVRGEDHVDVVQAVLDLEQTEFIPNGMTVVEAVWEGGDAPAALVAFGTLGTTYAKK